MTTFIYLWCAAIVFGLTAGKPGCDHKDGQCSFGDVCLNKDDEGSCKSVDIEIKGDECIKFNVSEEYGDYYLRIKLINGFISGSKLLIGSTMDLDERRNTTAHLYSFDSREMLNISFGVQWNSTGNGGFYQRFPNDSKMMKPVGWAETRYKSFNISDQEVRRNNGNFKISTMWYWVALKFISPDLEELKNPLVLHLTTQILPTRICHHVRPNAALFEYPARIIDVRTKVEAKDENIATNCTIFDRSTSVWSTPPNLPLSQGFESGKMISVRASLRPDAVQFNLRILDRHHSPAYQLLVHPRIARIDLSYVLDGKSHGEIVYTNTLFNVNETFKLNLYLEKNDLLIFVNDSLAADISLNRIINLPEAYLELVGDVIVDTVCYEDGKAPLPEAENIATNCTIFDRSTSKRDITAYLRLRKGFESGKMISVRASLKPEAHHLNLQIVDTHHFTAYELLVQPKIARIDLRYVLDGIEHYETESLNTSFNVNETFKLDLYLEKNNLLIFVNDSSAAIFSLEGSIKLPRAYLHVFGDVIVDTVCYEDGMAPVPALTQMKMKANDSLV